MGRLCCGTTHSVGVTEDGEVRAWGRTPSTEGALGLPSPRPQATGHSPELVPSLAGGPVRTGGAVSTVAASQRHSHFLREDGVLVSTGGGFYGTLGNGAFSSIGYSSHPFPGGVAETGSSPVLQVQAGDRYAVVLLADRTVRAFGKGANGRLGYGSTSDYGWDTGTSPVNAGPVPVGGPAVAVTAGTAHSGVVLQDGGVVLCGDNSRGQLGLGSQVESSCTALATTGAASRAAVCPWDSIVAATLGDQHSLFLTRDGGVFVAGRGDSGQLGLGNAADGGRSPTTTPCRLGRVVLGGRAVSLFAGVDFSGAVLEDGSVRAWGSSLSGRLSRRSLGSVGSSMDSLPFLAGPSSVGAPVVAVEAGAAFVLLLTQDGELRGSGASADGQLGLGSRASRTHADSDDAVTSLSPHARQLDAVERKACAISGYVRSASHVVGNTGLRSAAVAIWAGRKSSVVRGDDGKFAALADRALLGGTLAGNWLEDNEHLFRINAFVNASTNKTLDVVSVSVLDALFEFGALHSTGVWLTSDGLLRVTKLPGQSAEDVEPLPIGDSVAQVCTGTFFYVALTASGKVFASGAGTDGANCLSSSVDADQIADTGLRNMRSIACGPTHTMLLSSAGTLTFCGKATTSATPSREGSPPPYLALAVSRPERFVAIASGDTTSYALTDDGRVVAWGSNRDGQLGTTDNTTVSAGITQTVGMEGTWPPFPEPVTAIAAGSAHAVALLSSGAVVTFGRGVEGQLGRGAFESLGTDPTTSVDKIPPVPLGERATAVAAGDTHTVVALESGRVMAFGGNEHGQLGPWVQAEGVNAGVALDESRRLSLHRPKMCDSVVSAASSLNPGASRPVLSPELFQTAPGGGAAPWLIDLTLAGSPAAWQQGVLATGSDVFNGVDQAGMGGDAARATRIQGEPASLKNSQLCPTGLVGASALSGAQVCLTPVEFGWRELVAPTGPNSTALGLVASVAGSSSFLPRGSSEGSTKLRIQGGLGWAGLLESVRDDGADRATAGVLSPAVSGASNASLSVWLSGGGSFGISAWTRRVRGCSFTSLSSLECTVLPAGTGGPGSLSVAVRFGTDAIRADLVAESSSLSFAFPRFVAVIVEGGMPTSGGGTLVVQGAGFGSDEAALPQVEVRPFGLCTNVSRSAENPDGELRCLAPPGVGTASVHISAAGQFAAKQLPVSYNSPLVTSLFPASVLAGAVNTTVEINGTDLALLDGQIDSIVIGGVLCSEASVRTPGQSVACTRLTVPPTGFPAPRELQLAVGGKSSGIVRGLFEGIGRPSVQAVSVAQLSDLSPRRWGSRLTGSALGSSAADVQSVTMDGQPVAAWSIAPGSAGLSMDVELDGSAVEGGTIVVTNRWGVSSAPSPGVVFQRPTLTSVSPAQVLVGARGVSVNLTGTSLGRTTADFDSAFVGGVRCPSLRVVVARRVVACEGLDAPLAWPSERTVNVTVLGQTAGASGLFLGVSAPSVQAVSVAQLSDLSPRRWGSRLTGSALGSSAADVQSVTMDGQPVAAWSIAPGSAGLSMDVELDGSAVEGGTIVVTNRWGVSSAPSPGVVFQRPTLTSVSPAQVLVGARGVSVNLTGTSLGRTTADFDSAFVGGVRCPSLRVVVARRVVACEGLDAPLAWPSERTVNVTVLGQTAGASGLFLGVSAPSVQAVSVAQLSPTLPRTWEAEITGTYLGTATGDADVTIDGSRAALAGLEFLPQSQGSRLRVMLRDSAAQGSLLRLANKYGVTSGSAPVALAFARPSVSACTPGYVLAGASNATVLVSGQSLGIRSEDIDVLELGGTACPSVSVLESGTELLCTGFHAPAVWTDPQVVRVKVAGQWSAPTVGVFDGVAGPSVTAIAAVSMPTSGGSTIRIVGSGFGRNAADVAGVCFRDADEPVPVNGSTSPCHGLSPEGGESGGVMGRQLSPGSDVLRAAAWLDQLTVEATVPPGAGRVAVSVVMASGSVSAASVLSYESPSLSEVIPATLLPGAVVAQVQVCGTNLPPARAAHKLQSIVIGGVSCGSVRLDPSRADCALCENLDLRDGFAAGKGGVIQAEVAGRRSPEALGIFEGKPAPRITSAEPRAAGRGSVVTLLGEGLGLSPADIANATVVSNTAGGGSAPCASWAWSSESAMTCVVPASLPLWQMSPAAIEAASGGMAPTLTFVVCTTVGTCTVSTTSSQVAATGVVAGQPPLVSPWAVSAIRTEGQPFEITVQWAFVAEEDEESVNNAIAAEASAALAAYDAADSFEVQLLSAKALAGTGLSEPEERHWAGSALAVREVTRSTGFRMQQTADTQPGEAGSTLAGVQRAAANSHWHLHRSTFTVAFDEPVFVRVAGRTTFDLPGAFSESTSVSPRSRRQSRMARLSIAILGTKQRSKGKDSKKKRLKAVRAGMAALVLKLLFNHLQLLSIISGVRLAWPPAVLSIFEAGQVTSSFSTAGLGVECFLGETVATAVGRAAGVVLSSPALMLWSAAVLALQMCLSKKSRRRAAAASREDDDEEEDAEERGEAGGGEPPDSIVAPVTCSSMSSLWLERVVVAAILIGFVTHASVTKAAFGLLACRRLFPVDQPEATHWVLTQDPNVDCSDGAVTLARLSVALPALILMTLGLPALALRALLCPKPPRWCREKGGCAAASGRACATVRTMLGCGALGEQAAAAAAAAAAAEQEEDLEATAHLFEPKTIQRWGFLFRGFRRRSGAQVWEVVNMARKTLVAGATVLLASGGTLEQAMAALCVAVVFLVAHTTVQPYELPTLNRLETLALTSACITLACVPILVSSPWDPNEPPLAATLATVLIVGSNVLVLTASVGVVLVDMVRRSVKKARKNVQSASLSTTSLNKMQTALASGLDSESGPPAELDEERGDTDDDEPPQESSFSSSSTHRPSHTVESPLSLLPPRH
ncbi:hypothetical protein FNF31_04943 [Cafeteria roenbergensis]|uniref:IPT/TIG domain-containing protein n=1 Tax=Cafeteria roenbergensis TaxID=33653 RepID=A0A5A8D1Y7_CAFRO|nr:hypothetical protein FNF31_04943 [Cafeteria roenbergensis]